MAEFLNVDQILAHLDLKEDMSGAEFGCGSALFSIALAKKLPQGRVFALDIQEEKLSALMGRIHKEKINNIKTVLCDLEAPGGSTLNANSLDIVLIPNMLFQTESKHAILNEATRILKTGGQMLVVEWLKNMPFSPRELIVTSEEIKKIAVETGFSLKKEFAAGDYHYALLFIK